VDYHAFTARLLHFHRVPNFLAEIRAPARLALLNAIAVRCFSARALPYFRCVAAKMRGGLCVTSSNAAESLLSRAIRNHLGRLAALLWHH